MRPTHTRTRNPKATTVRATATTRGFASASELFAALGDATRLRLVARLGESGPLSIARLTEGEKVSRQAITKHLRILANAGLVSCLREGRETHWELEEKRLGDARRLLDEISRSWDDALERLRVFVEDGAPALAVRRVEAPRERPISRAMPVSPCSRLGGRRARRGPSSS